MLDAGLPSDVIGDAAIVEAARAASASAVVTEDLAEGQDYGGVVVENPFS